MILIEGTAAGQVRIDVGPSKTARLRSTTMVTGSFKPTSIDYKIPG